MVDDGRSSTAKVVSLFDTRTAEMSNLLNEIQSDIKTKERELSYQNIHYQQEKAEQNGTCTAHDAGLRAWKAAKNARRDAELE